MSVVHKVTGYDKRTECLALEWDVPAELMRDVRSLAGVPPDDSEAAGSYPLDPIAIRAISTRLRAPMSADAYDWFLEPFAGA